MDEKQHTGSELRGTEDKVSAPDKASAPLSPPQTQIEPEDLQQHHVNGTIKRLRNRGYKVTVEYDATGQRANFTAEVPLKKTRWDWIQLLIVPLVLLLIGSLLSALQSWTSYQVSERQYQEEVLQTYIDRMSDLIITDSLLKPEQSDKWKAAQTVAREQTLTALQRLDAEHRTIIVRFLAGAGLITGTYEQPLPIISLADSDLEGISVKGVSLPYADLRNADLLSDADLSQAILNNADLAGAHLTHADLYEVGLKGAHLRDAILEQARLSGADLSGADLSGADLSGADLQGAHGVMKLQLDRAKSLEGAIMPDGSRHP